MWPHTSGLYLAVRSCGDVACSAAFLQAKLCAGVHLPALGLAIGIDFRIAGLICL